MTYKEMLELYKNGQLPKDEAEEVRKEIEKQEAIGDYLFSDDMPELEGLSPDLETESGDNEDRFISLVRRSIRRAFIKTGVVSGFVVLVLVLSVIFILPKAVDKFYYNPNEVAGEEKESGIETTKMSLDLSVYSELFMPQAFRNEVKAESEGYGEYFISIPQVLYSPNGTLKTVNGKLERNKLRLYDTDVFTEPAGNAFMLPENVRGSSIFTDTDGSYIGPNGNIETAKEYLDEKPDIYYGAFVSLKEVTDYEEFIRWIDENDLGQSGVWAAVYADDVMEDGTRLLMDENVGFRVRTGGICIDYDRDTYPMLSLLDSEDNDYLSYLDGEKMKTHFISLLQYQRDNRDFMHIMQGHTTYGEGFFNDYISYVEENGLKVYGFYIEEKKDTINKLWEDERVSYIYATNIK